MSKYVIKDTDFIDHPKDKGVFMKILFTSKQNDRLTNGEIKINPDSQVSLHTHDNTSEFYYIVEGVGEFHINGECNPVKKGDALMCPMGTEHGFKNTGREPLILFVTFSPAVI